MPVIDLKLQTLKKNKIYVNSVSRTQSISMLIFMMFSLYDPIRPISLANKGRYNKANAVQKF